MAKKNFEVQCDDKQSLGKLISCLRKAQNMSLRKFAKLIEIPPSNVTYIEKGVNAPSPEIYARIINILSPQVQEHQDMDMYYCKIRNVPPPDVCEILLKTPELREKLRLLDDVQLSSNQLESIGTLFLTFKQI
jgi:transcriptional regulator with XRE-family HTH domain